MNIKREVLETAAGIVDGARRKDYGTPEDNFERIARFWNAYFENRRMPPVDGPFITAKDVSPMMRLMKEARLCETPDHYDSHVDLAGYTATGAEVNGVRGPDVVGNKPSTDEDPADDWPKYCGLDPYELEVLLHVAGEVYTPAMPDHRYKVAFDELIRGGYIDHSEPKIGFEPTELGKYVIETWQDHRARHTLLPIFRFGTPSQEDDQ